MVVDREHELNNTEPAEVYFVDLMRFWAACVARCVVSLANEQERKFSESSSSPFWPDIHECWIDERLGLYMRYSRSSRKLAVHRERMDIDPTTDMFVDPLRPDTPSGTAMQQACNVYQGNLDVGDPVETDWTDALGYGWWGDVPQGGWQYAVESAPRAETVIPLKQK